jgi:poly(3-hydroxybutyrate) depolymerase
MRIERCYAAITLAMLAGAAGCGPDDNPFENGTDGGTAGTAGGSTGTSGSTFGGGKSGASGSASVAGSAGTGGGKGGGGNATAGTDEAGGESSAGTSSAGSNSAGSSTGGSATGGSGDGSGGANNAGSAGSGTAGAAPTSGCNASDWPPAAAQTLMVEGTEAPREFIVALPEDYDPSQPYRLVFAFHGLTGTAEQIAGSGRNNGYYGLASRIGDSSILIAPQGLAPEDEPDQYGWPNEDGRDIAFVRAMVEWASGAYCVDQNRIFSVGMSYGGIMSNTIGCQMADVFRAIAPVAGALFGRGNSCMGPPIAAWMAHGTADETVTYEQGESARDAFLAKNHCDTSLEPTPVEPEGCVSYQGCDAGYPVIWCSHDGGHTVPSFTGDAVSAFFSGF